jgi:hypothetical protein
LAAAQYTRMEIQEYIKDLQSHYKPSPAESSTKDSPIPQVSYIAPSPALLAVHSHRLEKQQPCPPQRQEPDYLPKIRNTTCTYNAYHPLMLYTAIEGDLAAAQHTRTEIREYISALQSHNEPRSPGTSTKCLTTPGKSYLAPKRLSFKKNLLELH